MEGRLPAHLEVSGILRAVDAQGGFATVIEKGEHDAGTILILTMERGNNARLWERMPQLDGSRTYVVTKTQDPEKPEELTEYLARRKRQDSDIWIVELDVPNPERFVAVQHK